jgi:arginine/ornithine transport system substrate-binding protein
MKKLVIAIVSAAVLALAAGPAMAKEWTSIRIATEGAYPPFNFTDKDGKLQGFDVDIANALCAEMKVKCSIVAQDWDGIIPALIANKYDAIIASMSITEKRKKKVSFSKKYYTTPAKFVRKSGSGIEINATSMKGKSVGVQRATIHADFVKAVFGNVVNIKAYGTQDEAYLDFTAGRIDLLLADSVALMEGFLKTDAGKGAEFVGPDYTDPKYFGDGAGIATRKGDADLAAKFTAAIAAIRANGVYQKINAKYFDFDVYGK